MAKHREIVEGNLGGIKEKVVWGNKEVTEGRAQEVILWDTATHFSSQLRIVILIGSSLQSLLYILHLSRSRPLSNKIYH